MHRGPWHLRIGTHSHQQKYRDLMDYHRLTLAWQPFDWRVIFSRPEENLLADEIVFFEHCMNTNSEVEALFDETSPESCLARFELKIKTAQSRAIEVLIDSSPDPSGELIARSRSQGRRCGAERWKHLPFEARLNFRALVLCLKDSPCSEFLIKRHLEDRVSLVLTDCPHQHTGGQNADRRADLHCRLQAAFLEGFLRSINESVRINTDYLAEKSTSGDRRCLQTWTLAP